MAKTVFDHVKAIYRDQSLSYYDDLSDDDRKTVQTYMINRVISMNEQFLPLINEVQRYGLLEPRETYLALSQIIPKGNHYSPYVKGTTAPKYELWLVELLAMHLWCSKSDALAYLAIYYKDDAGKAALRRICEQYGKDHKTISKAKL